MRILFDMLDVLSDVSMHALGWTVAQVTLIDQLVVMSDNVCE
jgi:hypothetical protein